MNSTLLVRASRLARPGMFVAACASIAAIVAATQLRKIGSDLEEMMDEISAAAEEIEALETKKASLINEIDALGTHRNEMLSHLHSLMASDIVAGKYDAAVKERANLLAEHAPDGGNFPDAATPSKD
jgi:septal ring factor EnvC (AmiA/AmiB activator)